MMAKYRITAPDGAKYEITAPDNATQEQVIAYVHQNLKPSDPFAEAAQESSGLQNFVAGMGGSMKGLALGAGQRLGLVDQSEVDSHKRAMEGLGTTKSGVAGQITGIAVPAAATAIIPGANTYTGAAATGAVLGALEPTSKGDSVAVNMIKGGAGGAAGKGLFDIAGKAITPAWNAVRNSLPGVQQTVAANAQQATQDAMQKLAQELGPAFQQMSAAERMALEKKVADAMATGKALDAAALARSQDFNALGVKPLQGQITRDATAFANERNLRSVAGVGEPIMQRLEAQNVALQDAVGGYANGARDTYNAGRGIADALKRYDATQKSGVDKLYGMARDELGRASPMDAHVFSTNANHALDSEMLGHYLPGEVRGILNSISKGEIPLTVDSAVKIDQVLSAAQRSAGNGSPQALAIGKVRDALNSTPIADNVGEAAKAAFDKARAAARSRFGVIDNNPALKASIDDAIPVDNFVQRFVRGGSVDELRNLRAILPQEQVSQIRAQIGADLQRAAFGENVAGDKIFAPERYAKALRDVGDDKLKLFFSPDEVARMHRVSRVGAYINSFPTAAPVSTSNSNPASIAANLVASEVPGRAAAVANKVASALQQRAAVKAAVNPVVPSKNADINPAFAKKLAAYLASMSEGAGAGFAAQGRQ